MLILAHAGRPSEPDEVWAAWHLDPLLLFGFVLAAMVYGHGYIGSGRRRADRRRAWCFAAALAALGVAVLSPLETLSAALASSHMVQHILLVLVAAPLLAMSAPSSTLLRGTPLGVRRAIGRWRRRLNLTARRFRPLRHPVVVSLLHIATLWFWHAARPYEAALSNPTVHVVEHATFVGTGVLFWRVIVGARAATRVSPGLAVLLVFGMGMQSVFLSLLLTFAQDSWYAHYATTTTAWGLTPLADQQLAGVIMWIPAGLIYVAAGLALLVHWIRSTEGEDLRAVPEPGERSDSAEARGAVS